MLRRRDLQIEAVDLGQLLDMAYAGQGARDRDLLPGRQRPSHGDQVAVVRAVWRGRQPDLEAAVASQQRRVDVGDGLGDHVGEDPLEGSQLQHLDVQRGDLPANLHVERAGHAAGQRGEHPAEVLHQRQRRPDLLGDDAAGLYVDRIRHELALQCQLHRPGDRQPRLVLGLDRAGPQVRRDHHGVEVEQRARRAGFSGEHVDARAGHPAFLDSHGERVLVHEATAGGVDDPYAGLDQPQLPFGDEPKRLRGLGQVDRDEVGLGQQLVQRDEPDPNLRRPSRRHVRVVGQQLHAKRRQPLRHQHPDPTQPDHADGLAGHLDAGELRSLPLPALERGVGRSDIAGAGKQQSNRVLGGGDDVRRRRVDHHDAAGGRSRYVDVVQTDAGPSHDLEPVGRRQRLGVDLGGAADDDGVDVAERR